ncbi:solute carrier family 25 member 53-like [Lepisosteus oculatus]|uniref:solute carrier family 25 member 53-like n=1 Tax=Lepisosteus oculatus TaxID=7918 RepID=UPI00371B0290
MGEEGLVPVPAGGKEAVPGSVPQGARPSGAGMAGDPGERGPEPPWLSSYARGAASSALATLATFPLYKTVFRQQLHGAAVREAAAQLLREGPRKFYRGVAPPLLAKAVQGTLLFGSHDTFLRLLPPPGEGGPHPQLLRSALAGLGSGLLEALVLTPLERVQNVLQDGRKHRALPTLRSVLRRLAADGAARGLYRGLLPIGARNGLGSALYFAFKDPLRDGLGERGVPAGVASFVSGGANGLAVSLLLYPLTVLIANMQAQVGAEVTPARRCLAALWEARRRRLALLYRGGSLVVLRSCLTWGLTSAVFDQLAKHGHRPPRPD